MAKLRKGYLLNVKIAEAKKIIDSRGLNVPIQVDGGINTETAELVKQAGAKILVAGSYLFGAENMSEAVEKLVK